MMAKAHDPAQQYVFVEDEDIFADDEHRILARKKEVTGHCQHPRASTSSRTVSASVIRKPNPVANRFHQDPVLVQHDAAKLHRAVKLLSSIPPPPSATNPQFTLHNIFDLWNRNNHTNELRSKWQPGLVEEKLGHDVYLNRNNYVEELEQLRQMLIERFVSNETASHLTYTYPSLSDHKRDPQRRNGLLKSAPVHGVHQNQRKNFFSQFSTSGLRTITYDTNKRVNLSKSQVDSKTQSQIVNSKGHINYRALFHSPKKHVASTQLYIPNNHNTSSVSSGYCSMPPSNYSNPSTASTASSSSSCSLVTPTRNALPGSASSRSEKLVSLASRSGDVRKSCNKNLQFDDVSYSEKTNKKPKKLSQLHGKKMLWAVDTLLKSQGVMNTDPEYKILYANVYRETTQFWLKYCEKRENGKYKDSSTGTSDFMVSVAKQLLPGVEQKLGISCSMIRTRKESAKRTLEIPCLKTDNFNRTAVNLPSKSQSFNESSSQGRKLHDSSSSVTEEIVFSPEVLSESNLCEGIDAVISSLDDLPPDPGDRSNKIKSALESVKMPSDSGIKYPPLSAANITIETVDSTPPVEHKIPSLPPSSINTPHSSLEETSKPNNFTDHSVSNLVTCPLEENVSSQHNHLANPVDLSIPQITSLNKSDVIDSSENDNGIDLTAEIITSLSTLPTISEVFGDDVPELPPQMSLDPTNVLSQDCVRNSPLDLKNIPLDCVVKLERYILKEDKTAEIPELPLDQSEISSSLTPCALVAETNISSPKSKLLKDIPNNDESPGEFSASSDKRRSKRKRNSDISSNENTPTSSSKPRIRKKVCSSEGTEGQSDLVSSRLRRSSRNKLPFDCEQEETSTSLREEQIAPLEDLEELKVQTSNQITNLPIGNEISHESVNTSINGVIEEEVVTNNRLNDDDNITALHAGESSTSSTRAQSPKNIDKENDSSMENISDADNQNWSPILKLKRSSKDIWSSELKKKRISRRKRENSENSPKSSPFLDLEGPFKYRLCKRARPGEYVSAVIKGGMYSKSFNKLVKNKVITKDCVLVNTVNEGLELKIPLELLKEEHIFFGPNKFQNMISDIVEDALCKLEGLESETSFNGFTLHDVNQASLNSSVMERTLKVIESTGEVVRPLFTMYKYALVKQSPSNFQDFYQIFVEILRTSLFLRKTLIEADTIQVRPLNTESPKKIHLEINIPVKLIGKNNRFKDNILKDLTPIHNIISC